MKNLLKKYINSVISPDEFNQFHDYINQKENSISVYKMMEMEWKQFLTEKNSDLTNPMLFERIQQTILIEEGVFAKKKLKFYSIGLRIAAILLIGLLFGSIWLYQQSHSSLNSQTQTVSIPYGAKTQFVMPDGSTVWLNSGSTLTYSGSFSKQRSVELNGEAFFDVIKSNIPFVVNTSYGSVKVLGTAFNVQAYPDDGFITTLERGSVNVVDWNNKQELILTPGEQAQFINEKLIKSTVNTTLFTSWKDGRLIFSREPFPNMMEKLERWFNIKIEYSANDFRNLWFTGTVEMETMTEVMEMICKAAPVSYSYNSQTRTIKIGAKK